jgi:hypothetical protein
MAGSWETAMKHFAALCGLIALFAFGARAQGVQGVFVPTSGEAYVGYTFMRFYALPNATLNMNGFDASVAYYLRAGWFAPEGELTGVFGSQAGANSTLVLGMGGGRARWNIRSGTEFWVHALAGGAHLTPQSPYGGEGAFAYEGGGGVDIGSRHQRIAYRLEGDIVGTRFFGVYQYSPKISAGIVFKF